MRSLWRHVARYRAAYLLGFATLVIVDLLDLVPPLVTRAAFLNLEAEAPRPFWHYAVAFFAAILVQMVFRYGWRHFFLKPAQRIANDVRLALFRHLTRLSFSYFNRAKTGDLMSRATNDLESVRNFLGIGVLLLADLTIYFCTVPPMLFYLSPRLTLFCLFPLPLIPFLVRWMGNLVHRRSLAVQELFAEVAARAQENFSGIRVVQSFVQEEAEIERFAAVGRSYLEGNLSLARANAAFHPALGFCFGLGLFAVVLFGGFEVIDGRLRVGDFVAFTQYLSKMIWPMMALGWTVSMYERATASLGRIDELLAERPEIADAEGAAAPPAEGGAAQGAIEIRGLTFRYPGGDRDALSGVTLSVAPGETLAVVGPVGSGKSTLIGLIPRLHEAPRGTVIVSGADVRDWPLKALRGSIGCVPQETFLFSDTIEENVAFGLRARDPAAAGTQAERERVERAIRLARVDRDVAELPLGLSSLLGERGVNLSGGQKQRLAIARAIATEPDLLLLDDCLSSVDAETEAAILKGLAEVRRGRTCMVASHRLSAVKDADRIAVLDEGRLVGLGTHAELLARGGLYAELWQRQQLEEALARA